MDTHSTGEPLNTLDRNLERTRFADGVHPGAPLPSFREMAGLIPKPIKILIGVIIGLAILVSQFPHP